MFAATIIPSGPSKMMSFKNLSRRNFFTRIAGSLALGISAKSAEAQVDPSRPGAETGIPVQLPQRIPMGNSDIGLSNRRSRQGRQTGTIDLGPLCPYTRDNPGPQQCETTPTIISLYKEDVQLMKALGAKAYRFSVAWPRVFPDGIGSPNPKGLDFYNRLLDELLANGIEPFATVSLGLPQALQDRNGGWMSRDTSRPLLKIRVMSQSV